MPGANLLVSEMFHLDRDERRYPAETSRRIRVQVGLDERRYRQHEAAGPAGTALRRDILRGN